MPTFLGLSVKGGDGWERGVVVVVVEVVGIKNRTFVGRIG